ncbi:peptidoglycan-binding protein LysM [Brucella endophytica]|uniref:Peptidoglycan-binding protein LysM n=2 Tax=Brucella endophytica TaxID=1963359 RepID=A0A916SM32_9HYPH|nr:LysM peptidoglycan-binding domain-containing protein [Brucella endophytica]GGB05821.1 peptidoglycan-binding protein LysM [Brucella endophytica]
MAYRIDMNARNRFSENGDTATPIPSEQGEAFRRDIALVLRELADRDRNGKDQAELGDRVFIVEAGDTLEKIARENHVDLAEALAINADEINRNGDLIHPGDIIILPAPEPEIVADTSVDLTGKPAGEDAFIDSLYERGNKVEYSEPSDGIDAAAETAAMEQDVADYLAALPPEARQAAALRLSQADWVDAGPAGIAVSNAVEAAGLETDPIEAFASEFYDRGNALEYADPSALVDHSRETTALADDINAFLDTLPESERPGALQNLYDRDWRDAGPSQIAIEQAAATSGIPLASTGHNGPQAEAQIRAVVDNARAAGDDPVAQFKAFAESYKNASPEMQSMLLHTGYGYDFINAIAGHATEPLGNFDPSVDNQSKPFETFGRLDRLTDGVPPELAAALVSQTTPEIERANSLYMEQTGFSMLGTGGVEAMLKVAGRIEGTSRGDSTIESWADMGFYAQHELSQSIGTGGSLTYGLEYSERMGSDTTVLEQEILPGVQQTQTATNSAVDAYSAHMEELRWLIENHGDTMSPDELQRAIDNYKTTMDKPEDGRTEGAWTQTEKQLQDEVSKHGETLLNQITQLGAFPDEPAEQKALIDKEIESILNDDRSYLAIQTALRTNPELLDSPAVLNFASRQARLTDRGRKLVEEIFTQYVQRDILPKIADFKPGDAASMAEIRDGLEKFRDGKFATLLGVTEKDMNKAIDAIEASLPEAGDTEAVTRQKMQDLDTRLRELDSHQQSGVRTFSSSTIPGQLLRTIGASASAVGLMNSAEAAFTTPNVETILKATFDAAGLAQRSIEIGRGLDMISPDSFAARYFDGSLRPGTKFLGAVGSVFDGVNSYQAFAGGDPLMGGIHAATAAGGLAATFGAGTIAGPIGLGVVILGVGASMIVEDVRENNKYETARSAEFLDTSELSTAASQALIDNSGDGHSPVPLLVEYAKQKGFDLEDAAHRIIFTNWLNDMSAEQLATLRDNLHHTIDEFGGNATKLEPTAADDYNYTSDILYNQEVVTPRQTFFGERFYVEDGDASPSSVTQIDIALNTLGIPELALPVS